MSFGQAVSTCFAKYVTFSGRARRSEYWYWQLFSFLSSLVVFFADLFLKLPGFDVVNNGTTIKYGWLVIIWALILLLPTIAVTVRRLHDTGRTGLWWLLSLVCCIGSLAIFFFSLGDSQPGANEYGPNPKGA